MRLVLLDVESGAASAIWEAVAISLRDEKPLL